GFTVESSTQLDAQSLLIRLQPAQDSLPCCSGCHQPTSAIHDTTIRRVRERDLLQYRLWLEVPVRRVRCAACGPRVEHIRWLPGRQRLTAAMIHWVESLVRLMPTPQPAPFFWGREASIRGKPQSAFETGQTGLARLLPNQVSPLNPTGSNSGPYRDRGEP